MKAVFSKKSDAVIYEFDELVIRPTHDGNVRTTMFGKRILKGGKELFKYRGGKRFDTKRPPVKVWM